MRDGDCLKTGRGGVGLGPACRGFQRAADQQARAWRFHRADRGFRNFRNEIRSEILATSRPLISGASTDVIGANGASVLGALDRGETLSLEALLAAHHELKVQVEPATLNE